MVANEVVTETVWAVARHQSHWWRGMNPKACEPRVQEGTSADSTTCGHKVVHMSTSSRAQRYETDHDVHPYPQSWPSIVGQGSYGFYSPIENHD